MNVIVSNKYQNMLATLDIDVIKNITGEFDIDELIKIFKNFYFNKMIIDITAIKDYQNIKTIQQLSVNFDTGKIILLLDDSAMVNSKNYLSKIVSMGIYNFTRNINAVKFLIDNSNSYKDVAQYHNLSNYNNDDDDANSDTFSGTGSEGLRVIGFKNVTDHAGATTLVYLLKKHLEVAYNVVAIEVEKEDFVYLNDKSLKSSNDLDLSYHISNNPDIEVVLVDLNSSNQDRLCNEIIYLVEPGLIKLNKLIRTDRAAFEKLKEKRVVLNKSILTTRDINDFEREAGAQVFYNIPYVDDKKEHEQVLDDFLIALGFSRLNNGSSNHAKIFNIFK